MEWNTVRGVSLGTICRCIHLRVGTVGSGYLARKRNNMSRIGSAVRIGSGVCEYGRRLDENWSRGWPATITPLVGIPEQGNNDECEDPNNDAPYHPG